MGHYGPTYFRLLSLLIFPMCKTVTESLIKVGRKCLSLWMTNSHLKVKLSFAETSVKVCYLWKWDLAVVLQCRHTYAHTHTLTPSSCKGNFSDPFNVLLITWNNGDSLFLVIIPWSYCIMKENISRLSDVFCTSYDFVIIHHSLLILLFF